MVGSAWADLSRTALVSDENSFVATGKDLPLLVVVFANFQEAIAVIWRDVCNTLLYLSKARLFYLCFTLLLLIAAPPVEHTFGSMLSFSEFGRISLPNSCRIEPGSYDSWIDTQKNSTIRAAVGSVINFYPFRTKTLEVRTD